MRLATSPSTTCSLRSSLASEASFWQASSVKPRTSSWVHPLPRPHLPPATMANQQFIEWNPDIEPYPVWRQLPGPTMREWAIFFRQTSRQVKWWCLPLSITSEIPSTSLTASPRFSRWTVACAQMYALDNVAGDLIVSVSILISLICLGFLLIHHVGTSLGGIAPGDIVKMFMVTPSQKLFMHPTYNIHISGRGSS